MPNDKVNPKSKLTVEEELQIVLHAIGAYSRNHNVDPSEISDSFADACQELGFPEYFCPLIAIDQFNSERAELGNSNSRGNATESAKSEEGMNADELLVMLNADKQTIKEHLAYCHVNQQDELLDELTAINKRIVELQK